MALSALHLADRLWDGRERIEDHHSVGFVDGLAEVAEVAERTAFVPSFGNATAFQTDDGLVMVDTGGFLLAPSVHEQVSACGQLSGVIPTASRELAAAGAFCVRCPETARLLRARKRCSRAS